MPGLSQSNRQLQIETPLGNDEVIMTELEGEESINGLFHFRLQLLSNVHHIDPKKIVGKRITAKIFGINEGDEPRYINGFVNRFSLSSTTDDGLRRYQLEIVPSLWILTQGQHYRLWEEKTVLEIVKEITNTIPEFGGLLDRTTATYVKREICTQFGESDFDFMTRLLAEEGINYFFEHSDGNHKLVLTDSIQGYNDCIESTVEFAQQGHNPLLNHINEWEHQFSFHTGAVVTADYNEQTPTNSHTVTAKTLTDLANIKRTTHESFYNYLFEGGTDGAHTINADNRSATSQRIMESFETSHSVAHGQSNCPSFSAGGLFTLSGHSDSEDRSYLITRVSHSASESNATTTNYSNQFSCLPSDINYRPAPTPSRAAINGPLTAKVIEMKSTASGGDKFAQVKVEFPWEKSQNSCWVRVGQPYAGKNWGSCFVPRVDQEVIVEFINGNPDRPLITGAVYNGANQAPPYTKTQSGIRTESKEYNELRFDDKSGEEQFFVKAGKDLVSEVANDKRLQVGNDQITDVENDQTTTINNEQKLSVKSHRTVEIADGDESVTLKSGSQNITLNQGDQTCKLKTGNHKLETGGSSTIDAKKSISLSSKQGIELKVGGSTIKVSNSGIELKMGANKLKMDASGVTVNGIMVKLNGSAMTEVKGGGMVKMQGGVTMIN